METLGLDAPVNRLFQVEAEQPVSAEELRIMEQDSSRESRSSREYPEVTRAVREGIRPDTVKGRMELFGDKLTGKVPLGVDAKDKTTRKVIGGGGKLLTVVRFGLFGVISTVFGGLFLWAGLNSGFDAKVAGTGVVVLALGLFCLLRAYRAWGMFRAITRA
jgi:hypothetical protein